MQERAQDLSNIVGKEGCELGNLSYSVRAHYKLSDDSIIQAHPGGYLLPPLSQTLTVRKSFHRVLIM